MRIGIDVRILQADRRGQGQYVYYLVKNLLDIDKKNEYVLFYNGFNKDSFVFPQDIPNLKQVWCRIPGRILRYWWSNFSFPPIELLIGKVDVFHNPFNFNFTHYTPIPTMAKMVATFNGAGNPNNMWESFDVSKINRWYKIIACKAAKVIAISNSAKEDFLNKAVMLEDKVKVVYYGVSETFKPIEDKAAIEAVLASYGLLEKRFILYVGAAEKNKNLSGLLEAFNKIQNKDLLKDIFLVLVGKLDEAFKKIILQAEKLGLKQKVIFTDFIGHQELPFIYNRAELFILPSFYEGFGIPIIEAMACGIPVAVSNCGGMPEVVQDAGLLFNPADPEDIASVLLKLLEDKKLSQQLKEKSFKRAEDFTWKKTAENTLAVYKEALITK